MSWSQIFVLLATAVITDSWAARNCLEPVSMTMNYCDITLRYSIDRVRGWGGLLPVDKYTCSDLINLKWDLQTTNSNYCYVR